MYARHDDEAHDARATTTTSRTARLEQRHSHAPGQSTIKVASAQVCDRYNTRVHPREGEKEGERDGKRPNVREQAVCACVRVCVCALNGRMKPKTMKLPLRLLRRCFRAPPPLLHSHSLSLSLSASLSLSLSSLLHHIAALDPWPPVVLSHSCPATTSVFGAARRFACVA